MADTQGTETAQKTTTPKTRPATPGAETGTQADTHTGTHTGTQAGTDVVKSDGDRGKTVIADDVVAKIAGVATREVAGVHSLGGGAARAVGAVRERITGNGPRLTQGVDVEVGERQAAVDISLIADYGVALHDLATAIRTNVIEAVERMTGLEVAEVNVDVTDVFIDTDADGEDDHTSRVE